MNVTTYKPHELNGDQLRRWKALLGSQPGLDSPFFHPTYARILGAVRPQIEVGVMTDNGEDIGFFPFERHRGSIGRPLGVKLCDIQGAVTAPDRPWSVQQLLLGCGLKVWHFDHLLTDQSPWQTWHLEQAESHYMDLSRGYAEYAAECRRAGTAQITQTDRKRRKLVREVGPIRFEWHTDSRVAFETILRWKSAQRRRTKTFDVLQVDWVLQALDQIRVTDEEDFSGVLSALYVNDRIIAAHLSMRTGTVLHHWFPTYDQDFYRYSPGLILLLEAARAAAARGIQRIDLGKGNESYKLSFRSNGLSVAEGAADLRPLCSTVRAAWFCTRRWIKSSPLRKPAELPKRLIRRVQNQLAMN